MKHEDDFITKLLDETYQSVEHPSNELSNQNVASLFDYFKEREDEVEGTLSSKEAITLKTYKRFIRLDVGGKTLDVPEELNWLESYQSPTDEIIYEVRDEAFATVLSELCGTKVRFIIVNGSVVDLKESLPTHLNKIPKVA